MAACSDKTGLSDPYAVVRVKYVEEYMINLN